MKTRNLILMTFSLAALTLSTVACDDTDPCDELATYCDSCSDLTRVSCETTVEQANPDVCDALIPGIEPLCK